jgi:hypothetical protein
MFRMKIRSNLHDLEFGKEFLEAPKPWATKGTIDKLDLIIKNVCLSKDITKM